MLTDSPDHKCRLSSRHHKKMFVIVTKNYLWSLRCDNLVFFYVSEKQNSSNISPTYLLRYEFDLFWGQRRAQWILSLTHSSKTGWYLNKTVFRTSLSCGSDKIRGNQISLLAWPIKGDGGDEPRQRSSPVCKFYRAVDLLPDIQSASLSSLEPSWYRRLHQEDYPWLFCTLL